MWRHLGGGEDGYAQLPGEQVEDPEGAVFVAARGGEEMELEVLRRAEFADEDERSRLLHPNILRHGPSQHGFAENYVQDQCEAAMARALAAADAVVDRALAEVNSMGATVERLLAEEEEEDLEDEDLEEEENPVEKVKKQPPPNSAYSIS